MKSQLNQNQKNNQQRHPAEGLSLLIQERAYERYLKRGQEPGHELEDWLLAEQDIRERKEIQPAG